MTDIQPHEDIVAPTVAERDPKLRSGYARKRLALIRTTAERDRLQASFDELQAEHQALQAEIERAAKEAFERKIATYKTPTWFEGANQVLA
jgi:flagellar biosynthesis/type III secretory pathway protein FliH